VGRIIEMAAAMKVEYLELANTQYYGWGLANRALLMPTREQLTRAEAIVNDYRREFGQGMRILFVVPDYFETRPKACMNGWGSVFLGISPDGTALPCHAARTLPDIEFPNVAADSLRHIWYDSDAFNKYRGDAWMKEPCRDCPEKTKDFGGCRCQAYALTGDAANADPVCGKSPRHGLVEDAVRQAQAANASAHEQPLLFRSDANSKRFAAPSPKSSSHEVKAAHRE